MLFNLGMFIKLQGFVASPCDGEKSTETSHTFPYHFCPFLVPRSPRKGYPGNPSPMPSGRCSVCRSQSPCSDIAVEGRALQSFAADGGGTWLAASSMKFRWNGSSCTAFRESSMHSTAQPLHSPCTALA